MTFEEARDMSSLSKNDLQIIVGGTYMHNSKSYLWIKIRFLAEISQMKYINDQKNDSIININSKK